MVMFWKSCAGHSDVVRRFTVKSLVPRPPPALDRIAPSAAGTDSSMPCVRHCSGLIWSRRVLGISMLMARGRSHQTLQRLRRFVRCRVTPQGGFQSSPPTTPPATRRQVSRAHSPGSLKAIPSKSGCLYPDIEYSTGQRRNSCFENTFGPSLLPSNPLDISPHRDMDIKLYVSVYAILLHPHF